MTSDFDRAPDGATECVTDGHPYLRVRTPADLVAAVPYLLGFHPRDSVVLLGTRGPGPRRLAFTARVDLPLRRHVRPMARRFAEVLVRNGCDEVLVVVVGGGGRARDRPPRASLVAELRRTFRAGGVEVIDAVWAPEVASGAPWRCYGPGERSGLLPDPASSPIAAAAVAAGQVTYPERDDLERLVAAPDGAALARRSALLTEHCDRECRRSDPSPHSAAESFALVESWVARAALGPLALDDEEVVALCLALSDPLVRDAAFGLATDADASAAERLWTTLARESPDPEAAEAAVLLAHCALLRGNGALAGVALERAQSAWPGHRLSAMFRCALDDGLGPDALAGWFAAGAAEASLLLGKRG